MDAGVINRYGWRADEDHLIMMRHATRLRGETTPRKAPKSVKGLWADLGISISAEEIGENRREMLEEVSPLLTADSTERLGITGVGKSADVARKSACSTSL